MIRFIRNLFLTVLILALIFFIALLVLGNYFIERAEGPLTRTLIGVYGPGDDDEFGYSGGLNFIPLRVTVNRLFVDADALELGGVVWENARLDVDKIYCDPVALVKENSVVVTGAEGRAFEGLLNNENLKLLLEKNNENMSDLDVGWYNERCRITGRIGLVSAAPMSILGDWEVDDRGVVTLVNRIYYNPDSPVPLGMIDILEDQISFDVRIEILNDAVEPVEVEYTRDGLYIKAQEPE